MGPPGAARQGQCTGRPSSPLTILRGNLEPSVWNCLPPRWCLRVALPTSSAVWSSIPRPAPSSLSSPGWSTRRASRSRRTARRRLRAVARPRPRDQRAARNCRMRDVTGSRDFAAQRRDEDRECCHRLGSREQRRPRASFYVRDQPAGPSTSLPGGDYIAASGAADTCRRFAMTRGRRCRSGAMRTLPSDENRRVTPGAGNRRDQSGSPVASALITQTPWRSMAARR